MEGYCISAKNEGENISWVLVFSLIIGGLNGEYLP
jgi:hypothetical protein